MSTTSGTGSSLVVYSTDAEPAALALVIGGAARAALANLADGLFTAYRSPTHPRRPDEGGLAMGRKILLVTTDQQRYDTLGCNGGTLARTPVVDGLAADGIRFERAHPQSVVCMPSRSTILTGQHPTTHGVWMNGVPLPVDAPSVAEVLRQAGYRTALVGKAHFEPFLDPFLRFAENALARTGTEPPGGAHRGLRAPGDGHPRRRGAAPLRPLADGRAPRGGRRLLPGPRRIAPGQRGRRRRHRGTPGEGQSHRSGDLPHRLGGRSDHRLARRPRAPTTTGSAG